MLRVIMSTLALLAFCVAGYCLALSFGDGHETFSSDKLLYLRVAGILLVGVGAYLFLALPSKKDVVHYVETQPFTPQIVTTVNPSTGHASQYMHSAPGVLIGITPDAPPVAYSGTQPQSPWLIHVAEAAAILHATTTPEEVVDKVGGDCLQELPAAGGSQAIEVICQVTEEVAETPAAAVDYSTPDVAPEAPSPTAQTDF